MGVDCVGLVAFVLQDLGIPFVDLCNYSRYPDGETLQKEIEKSLRPILLENAQPGDVVSLRLTRYPCHVAILSDIGMIHTYTGTKKVVEHRIDDTWRSRFVGAYKFPGV